METRCFFFREDLEALDKEIERIKGRIRSAGREMGESCKEGAETFHDNFAFEEGSRQQHMWSERLRDLIKIRNRARIVQASQIPNNRVSLGKTVTYEDLESGEIKTLRIGSYMVFDSNGEDGIQTVSYTSPIAQTLIGNEEGEICEGKVGGKTKTFMILELR